jgi:hypothetical protein
LLFNFITNEPNLYRPGRGGAAMSEIIVTADLGAINAFEIIKDPMKLQSDRLKMIKGETREEPRARAAERFSDAAGRFYQGGGTGGTAAGVGEQHNLELETEKRAIKHIAEVVNELAADEKCDKWFLAAEKSINNQILEYVRPDVKAKLKKNVAADLTKASKRDILGHFAERTRRTA